MAKFDLDKLCSYIGTNVLNKQIFGPFIEKFKSTDYITLPTLALKQSCIRAALHERDFTFTIALS